MKKAKQSFGKLLALVLTVMLTLTAAVPALAAPGDPDPQKNLTITIRNNTGLPAMKNEQFAAYQLFKGSPNKETPDSDPNSTENDWNATNWNNYTLANIEWGANINGDSLLNDLKGLSYSSDTIWPEFFESTDPYENLFTKDRTDDPIDTAAELAEFLVGRDNAFLQAFSKFVVDGKDGKNPDDPLGYLKTDPAPKSTYLRCWVIR